MIIILHFGGQSAHLIARRARDLGVKAEIFSFDTTLSEIKKCGPAGIILSGGPSSVLDKNSPKPDKGIFQLGIPILGICYGHQVMAHMLGGRVARNKHREFGKEILTVRARKGIFRNFSLKEIVWFSHGDQVINLPDRFKVTAETPRCAIAAYENEKNNFFGMTRTPYIRHKGRT